MHTVRHHPFITHYGYPHVVHTLHVLRITTSFFETQYVKTLCTGSSFTDDDVIFFCFFFIHGSRLQMGRLSVEPPSNVGVFFLFFRGGFIAALAVATATLPRSSQPLIAFVLRSREPTTSPCAQNGRNASKSSLSSTTSTSTSSTIDIVGISA